MIVEQPTEQVNARRAYNSDRRRQRSRDTHNALLDAALTRFLEYGYSATTIDSIAANAAVSAATIYKTYGSKARPGARPVSTCARRAGPGARRATL